MNLISPNNEHYENKYLNSRYQFHICNLGASPGTTIRWLISSTVCKAMANSMNTPAHNELDITKQWILQGEKIINRGCQFHVSLISSALAFCPFVTLKKRSYEGLAPPWKLSQIVEIRFFRKFQVTKNSRTKPFPRWGVIKNGTMYQNVRLWREHFHISREN